ncbi:GPI mannosyltransferase 1 [Phlebotomus argentipes]|uniref:GPI mannosyltransferase 1 n=1 Tax=Phlebotomus argentipes TaxID=94469 RepID=UPI0028931090|nr:GPI mannosyltransferase 1 [Phlebotomus argentipes]
MLAFFFSKVPFGTHLAINFAVRIALIVYGDFMDRVSHVPYTDIDYKVITDAAAHVLNGDSPYRRETFRYSPLLAFLVLPNHFVHRNFGKFLFVLFDLAVGVLIRRIVDDEYRIIYQRNAQVMMESLPGRRRGAHKRMEEAVEVTLRKKKALVGQLSAYMWLYNPLTMVIATRGNGDAIASLLVLLTLHFIQKPKISGWNCFVAGIFHGIAIHFRLYPLGFSLAYYLSVSGKSFRTAEEYFNGMWPNRRQLALVGGTLGTLMALTVSFYVMYGQEFLHETYIYHLIRTDVRHNFSVLFYMQYLRSVVPGSGLEKVFTAIPVILVLLAITVVFGRSRQTLSFGLFALALTMVTYNSVVTSQYFIWYIALLPISAKNLTKMGKSAVAYAVLWFLAQGAWLLPAYLLEFQGWDTFDFIWLQGLVFFSVNVFILSRLIAVYETPRDFTVKQK